MFYQIPVFVRLFPLLLPIWQERPLTRADLMPSPYPNDTLVEDVRLQEQAFLVADIEQRCSIARDLRNCGRRDAYDLLLKLLVIETEPVATATFLECLATLPFQPAPPLPDCGPWLRHADGNVRYWAVQFYPNLPAWDAAELVTKSLSDPLPRVRTGAADALSRHHAAVDRASYLDLIRAADAEVRAAAIRGLCRKPLTATAEEQLTRTMADTAVVVRHSLADSADLMPPPLRAALIDRLANDAHASVRGAVAASTGRDPAGNLPPMLLQLSADRDPDVRRRAAASIAAFPGPPGRERLVAMLGDERFLVRSQAENALVIVHEQVPVIEAAATRLEDDFAPARFHVYRILGRLGAGNHARALAARLPHETDAEIIAALVHALYRLDAAFAATAVAALHDHASPLVREEVGRALGGFETASTYRALKRLAFDAEENVRHAAIIGMGRIADGSAFSRSIRHVLEAVNLAEMTPRNRAAGAWAAGRLRPVDNALMDRLVIQATVPVVPGIMGPEFEGDQVLVSVSFALAECARNAASVRARAESVQKFHSHVPKRQAPSPGAAPTMPPAATLTPSLELREYTRQARAHMNGTAIEQRERPIRRFDFSYRVLLKQELRFGE